MCKRLFNFTAFQVLRSFNVLNFNPKVFPVCADNQIDQLNQRSLVGLESSLVQLNLVGNRLTTIDRCTFHRLTRLEPKSLMLRGNSLSCDCRLRWLYDWTNGSRHFHYWRCRDGRPFSTLTDADFRSCNDSATDNQRCEDLTPTTTTTKPRPLIGLSVFNVTSSSFAVRWTVDAAALPAAVAGFRVNCSCADSWSTTRVAVRQKRFVGLRGGTEYRVCVTLWYRDGNWTEDDDDEVSCLAVTTTARLSETASPSVVVISSVSVVVVLLLTVVVCVAVRRWRRRRRIRLAQLAQPKITAGKTKHFMRQQQWQQQRPYSLEASATDRVDALRFHSRSVEANLDTLADDEDDRYRTLLAIHLLQSRNARSLDNLVDGTVNAAPSYVMNQLCHSGLYDNVEQEVYDEINEAEVKFPLMTEDDSNV